MTNVETFWAKQPELLILYWGTAMANLQLARDLEPTARFYAWAAALGVTRPQNLLAHYEEHGTPNGGNGVEWMVARFERVSELTKAIWSRAEQLNPKLHDLLIKDWDREEDSVGENEPGNVPLTYFDRTPAVALPANWGVPRLLMLLGEEGNGDKVDEIVDVCLRESADPEMFLCRIAERVFTTGVPAEKVMDFVLKTHQAEEHNSWKIYWKVLDILATEAPQLHEKSSKVYEENKDSDKRSGWMKMIDKYQRGNES